jgi:hypothetical protein
MFRSYIGLTELCGSNYTRNISKISSNFTAGLNEGGSLFVPHQAAVPRQ